MGVGQKSLIPVARIQVRQQESDKALRSRKGKTRGQYIHGLIFMGLHLELHMTSVGRLPP